MDKNKKAGAPKGNKNAVKKTLKPQATINFLIDKELREKWEQKYKESEFKTFKSWIVNQIESK